MKIPRSGMEMVDKDEMSGGDGGATNRRLNCHDLFVILMLSLVIDEACCCCCRVEWGMEMNGLFGIKWL